MQGLYQRTGDLCVVIREQYVIQKKHDKHCPKVNLIQGTKLYVFSISPYYKNKVNYNTGFKNQVISKQLKFKGK